MIRNLVILGLSLSLIASIIGAASKSAQRNSTGAANIQAMTDEIARIEDRINAIEEQKLFQPEIRTSLARLKGRLEIIRDSHLERSFRIGGLMVFSLS